jgi:hypothetical protein
MKLRGADLLVSYSVMLDLCNWEMQREISWAEVFPPSSCVEKAKDGDFKASNGVRTRGLSVYLPCMQRRAERTVMLLSFGLAPLEPEEASTL